MSGKASWDRVEFVQDEAGGVVDADGAVTPSWMGGTVRPADDAAVAVLLVDTRQGLVTYANPAALALTGGRAHLPVEASAWTAAARLVLPGGNRPDGLNAVPVVDPVSVVAAGGVVPGMRMEVTDDTGRNLPYWVTGSQLLTASGVAGSSAIVALFPVPPPHDAKDGGLARAPRMPQPAGPGADGVLAGADGAAIARADATARTAVVDEALREVTGGVPETGLGDIDELTARALVASSVSFTISDPRRPDDPLVWVNPAFERMTGYTAREIVGLNCRFLQGPGTDRGAVRRLGESLRRGEAVRAELLNYRKDGTPFWNSFTISPVLDGDNQLTHFVGVQTDITARVIAGMEYERLLTAEREARAVAEQAKSRLDVMVDVGALLTETLDADAAMRRLAEALVPRLADYCIVDLVDRGDETPAAGQDEPADDPLEAAAAMLRRGRRIAAVHRDEELGAMLAELSPDPAGEAGRGLGARALATSEALLLTGLQEEDWVAWAGDDPRLAELSRRLASHAVIVAPMRARGRVVGALSLGQGESSGRSFDDADLGLARTLAARAGLAVDNALLFEAESSQRRRADALAAAGTALAASGLHSSDAVTVLLDHVVPAMGAWALVHADEKASPALRKGDTAPGLRLVVERADHDLDAGAVGLFGGTALTERTPGPGQAWSTGMPQIVTVDEGLLDADDVDPAEREALRPLLGGQLVSVPLTVRATTFGTLTVVRPDGAAFTGDEVRYLGELARRAALTLDNARLYENERLVALELQRSLLPARLPRIAELDVAGRYLAGAAGTEVGGDWYDVIPLPEGRVAVAVGDVMGRGVHAAAVMGQMRAALRSYAVEGLDPPQLLAHLAAFAQVLEGDHLVTCLVGIHDAASGTVTFASAGHPPPLRLGADGDVGYVDVVPGLPLGVPAALERGTADAGEPYPEATVKLAPGSTLLLYTDGLVEDRNVPVATGLQQLAEAFQGRPPATAEETCTEALRTMGRDTSHDDDTAVLALRATSLADGNGPGLGLPRNADPLEVSRIELQANPHAPAAARRAVTARLTEAGLADHVDTATLLVSELVTNALRHGGGPEELIVEIDADGVSIGVRDSSLQPPQEEIGAGPGAVRVVGGGLSENGRGLLLVDLLADTWGWRPESGGKLVWFRLERDGVPD